MTTVLGTGGKIWSFPPPVPGPVPDPRPVPTPEPTPPPLPGPFPPDPSLPDPPPVPGVAMAGAAEGGWTLGGVTGSSGFGSGGGGVGIGCGVAVGGGGAEAGEEENCRKRTRSGRSSPPLPRDPPPPPPAGPAPPAPWLSGAVSCRAISGGSTNERMMSAWSRLETITPVEPRCSGSGIPWRGRSGRRGFRAEGSRGSGTGRGEGWPPNHTAGEPRKVRPPYTNECRD